MLKKKIQTLLTMAIATKTRTKTMTTMMPSFSTRRRTNCTVIGGKNSTPAQSLSLYKKERPLIVVLATFVFFFTQQRVDKYISRDITATSFYNNNITTIAIAIAIAIFNNVDSKQQR